MENKKFLKDLSGSAIQIAVTQVASLLIFYLISKYISKEEFGFYNWATALCSIILVVLSLGMDLVYVRRVSANIEKHEVISIHLFHTLFVNSSLVVITSVVLLFFPNLVEFKTLFLLVLINQSIIGIGNSIKYGLNGLEQFGHLAKTAVVTSFVRILTVGLLFVFQLFTMKFILMAFIVNYLFEFCLAYYFSTKALSYYIRPKLYLRTYKELIKESFPQLGVVLFDSAIARIDWVLMGFLATGVKTAEYAFAFKMFEVSKMPSFIIAPILLTRFSKIFTAKETQFNKEDGNKIDNLFSLEMFIAIVIPVVAIVIWTDLFDLLTNGKYGSVNQLTYMLLAVCIPLYYANNLLWTLAFTQGQLKMIFKLTVVASLLNTVLNLILIPIYNSEGAAFSFLISTVVQLSLYIIYTDQKSYQFKKQKLFVGLMIGVVSVFSVYYLPIHWILKGTLALGLCVSLMISFKMVSLKILKSAFI